MANWIKENIVLTDIGRQLLAHAQIGNGKIEITRIVAREEFETVNAPARMREYILSDIPDSTIQQEGILLEALVGVANPDPENPSVETSLISVRFSNDDLGDVEKSYNLRQIIVMARLIEYDNDLGEVPYMVAQCEDFDSPDFIPPRKNNPTSMDYDLYIIHSGVPEITISLRTSGFVFDDTYNREVTKIWNFLNNLESNEVGQHTENKEFKIWKPVYENGWSKVYTGETLIGHKTAERFNLYGVNEDGTYSDNVAIGECSHVEGAFNEVLAPYSHVEGANNYVSADSNSVSVGGTCNSIYKGQYGNLHGSFNKVGENDSTASTSFNVSGTNNTLNNSDSATVSGNYNTLNNSSNSAIFGAENTLGSRNSLVVGAFNNVNVTDDINNTGANMIAGITNTVSDSSNTSISGEKNTISHATNSIIGGSTNEISDSVSGIISGTQNTLTGNSSLTFVSGQKLKVSKQSQASICSGFNNTVENSSRTVVSGTENNSKDTYNSLISGRSNTLNIGDNNSLSGAGNTLASGNNSVLSGYFNDTSNLSETFITGNTNTANGDKQSVITGTFNNVNFASCALIGGRYTKIYGSNDKEIADILAVGANNTVQNENTMSIQNGKSVITGTNNTLSDFTGSVLSGDSNAVQNIMNSSITGSGNAIRYIRSTASNANSLGVRCCDVSGSANEITHFENSVITGSNNVLSDYKPNNIPGEWKLSPRNNVISGEHNTVSGLYSSIVTGYGHTIKNIHDAIIGGRDNIIDGLNTGTNGETNSVLVMGANNNVINHLDPQAVFGRNHNVSGNNVLVTGHDNIASGDNCIVAGEFNEGDTNNKYVVIIGGGTSDSSRRNIMTLDRSGNLHINNLYVNDIKNEDGTDKILVSRSEFDALVARVAALESRLAELP